MTSSLYSYFHFLFYTRFAVKFFALLYFKTESAVKYNSDKRSYSGVCVEEGIELSLSGMKLVKSVTYPSATPWLPSSTEDLLEELVSLPCKSDSLSLDRIKEKKQEIAFYLTQEASLG